ncbi:helix-turn-helix transcriptional regulator [Dactylosporangium sp. NPDC050688]|uniref:helix-turn-helix domain-containing protein n=1 Tax=Dactylosporangium sp. NPDC050688 TaxID=3157217 RepID=UPI0033C17A48
MAPQSPVPGTTPRRLAALQQMLGGQLRRLRTELGIDQAVAGRHIGGSASKISRIELGDVRIKEHDLELLLDLYRVTAVRERAAVLQIASLANNRQWWHQYGDVVADWFGTYLALESAAESIRTYELRFVPGLLQTPAYAEVVIRRRFQQEEVGRRLALRMHRQRMLLERGSPTLWAIIDEAALRQRVGAGAVMEEQLAFLAEAARRPNIKIQILPIKEGLRIGAGNSFTLLRLRSSHLADVVYMEHLDNAEYFADPHHCEPYKTHHAQIIVAALRPEETQRALTEIAQGKELSASEHR